MSQLVVVTGPIASGKSVLSAALADRLSSVSRSAVVVDLDDVVATVHTQSAKREWTWEKAREAHGVLVGHWLSSGVDVVIAHGPFHSETDSTALLRHVPPGIRPRRVLLLASYEVDRVALDPGRGLSKNPSFLQSAYDRFFHLLPGLGAFEWTFDTTTTSVNDAVTVLCAALLWT